VVAALHLAHAVALLGMVTRFSDGPVYADHSDVIEPVRTESDAVREEALQIAEDVVAAYAAVGERTGCRTATSAIRPELTGRRPGRRAWPGYVRRTGRLPRPPGRRRLPTHQAQRPARIVFRWVGGDARGVSIVDYH